MEKELEFMDTNEQNFLGESEPTDFYDKEIMELGEDANLIDDDFSSIGEELNDDNFSAFIDSENNEELRPVEFETPSFEFNEMPTLNNENVSVDNIDLTSDTKQFVPETIEKSEEFNLPLTTAESEEEVSDFDSLFNNLYSDVVGANNYISNLIEKKTSLTKNEKTLEEVKEKFEKEKIEFDRYVAEQRKSIEKEKQQCDEYVVTQRQRIESEEAKFNEDVLAKNTELELLEQSLNITKEQLETEKEQFENYKKVEEEKITNNKAKLEAEKSQFEKEKEMTQKSLKERQEELSTKEEEFAKYKDLEQEKINSEKEQFEKEMGVVRQSLENSQKELSFKQDQFAKFKEVEEKKLELENKNLAQSCARFKTLVSQFNTSFAQLPNDKD